MLLKLYLWIRKNLLHTDDRSQLQIAIANGLKIGSNCNIMDECILDPRHCFLITIGNNVTLVPRVHILAHDASTKRHIEYTVIWKVNIDNNVFIGTGSIILPNTIIGDNVIIGAGSVVKHNIPNNSVAVGSLAHVICSTDEYIEKRKYQFENSPCYDESYKIDVITSDKKQLMLDEIETIGFIK